MKILVDIEERRSSVPEHLASLGLEVEFVRLPHGDYLIAGRVAVERKTVADLHRSMADARLWSQVAGLAQLERGYSSSKAKTWTPDRSPRLGFGAPFFK